MKIKPFIKLFSRQKTGVRPAHIPAELASDCIDFVARQFGNSKNVDVLQSTLNDFKELSDEEKSAEFGRVFFRMEKFVVGMGGPGGGNSERDIRRWLFREIPEAADHPPFDMCAHSVPVQEFMLCRYFLLLVCNAARAEFKGDGDEDLVAIIEWLDRLCVERSWPPPIKVLVAPPDSVEGWAKALEDVNGILQIRLQNISNDARVLDLYEQAFEIAAGTYKGLHSFSVVYGLLPRILLDDEKLAMLESRHELQARLDRLEQTNLELTSANNALTQTKKALSRAQQESESNASLVRKLLDTAGEAIIGIRTDGEILFANEVAAQTWGYSRNALCYMKFHELLDQESADFFAENMRNSVSSEHTRWMVMNGVREDGSYVPIKLHARTTSDYESTMITVAARDLTETIKKEEEEVRLREKLEHAERMESIGLLAGGVAHDLNNILGPLVAYPELILETLNGEHEIREDVEEIGKSARRAAAIIQDLLTMSRQGHFEFSVVDLNQVIRDFVASPELKSPLEGSSSVALKLDLDPACPPIRGSAHHLVKIFMNLCINALDAMALGGLLTVTTEYDRDDTSLMELSDENDLGCVVCRVRDTGDGIPAEHIKRIFEPFYSTKKLGRSGSGLGLSVVYGVIQDLGGDLEVISEVGIGTDFIIKFPVVVGNVEETPYVDEREPQGTERILIVDDEIAQLKLATRLLGSLGYQVDCVATGRSAIDFLQQGDVDLVVLDMMIEDGFDGLDTYQIIHEYWPNTACLLASGYSESDRVKEAIRLGAGGFIKKPYSRMDLARSVRNVIDEKVAQVAGEAKERAVAKSDAQVMEP